MTLVFRGSEKQNKYLNKKRYPSIPFYQNPIYQRNQPLPNKNSRPMIKNSPSNTTCTSSYLSCSTCRR